MEFAVRVAGLDEPGGETCRWVMAVDGTRFLIVDGEGAFHWREMADCTFVKAATADTPRPVVAIQPKQGPQLVAPNREVRRLNGLH